MIGGSSILSRDPGTGHSVRHFNYLGNGGVRLAATCREANDEPAAVVAFAHGFTAHMGAYINVLRTLTAAGFVTYAVDHRGHGYSEGKRASLHRMDDMVDDFERLVAIARAEHPDLPLFTLGHSMGGLIVVRHGIRFQEGLAGMIPVSGALIIRENLSEAMVRFLVGMSNIAPNLPVINSDPQRPSGDDAAPTRRRRSFLSYKGRVRLNMARELYIGGMNALDRAGTLQVPLLIQHGREDQVTMPSGSEALFAKAPSRDRTLELWTGRFHNLITDEGWEDPVVSIVDWIRARSCFARW